MSKGLYPGFDFSIIKQGIGNSRVGELKTPHGIIPTPNFIFCGTKANVKGVTSNDLTDLGTSIILANTYHLMLSPGADLIEELGGLHKFTRWNGPMLTDSGGYQIFAMGSGSVGEEIKGRNPRLNKSLLKITEEGVVFKSYIDGKKFTLTPEGSIEIQKKLGADLIVQFDECTPFHVSKNYTEESMYMSLRWGDRCLRKFFELSNPNQAIYSVVQGGVYGEFRKVSVEEVLRRDFFGNCIGGCLGGDMNQMHDIVSLTMEYILSEKPVHLLGIGRIEDIFHGVEQGVDTFDCVHPTRMARHGQMIFPGSKNGYVNLNNAKYKRDESPLDPECPCGESKLYSKAYVHHLFRNSEMLGPIILTRHNIAQMNRLLGEIRKNINDLDNWRKLKKKWLYY